MIRDGNTHLFCITDLVEWDPPPLSPLAYPTRAGLFLERTLCLQGAQVALSLPGSTDGLRYPFANFLLPPLLPLATHLFNIIATDRLAKSRKGFLTKSMLQKILSIHRTSICRYAKRLQSHGGTHQFSTPPKETKWGMSEDRP